MPRYFDGPSFSVAGGAARPWSVRRCLIL